jgi:hypothetical protein
MQLDNCYLKTLCDFINCNGGKSFEISALTKTPERFIYHLKCYIDNRLPEMNEITLIEKNSSVIGIKIAEDWNDKEAHRAKNVASIQQQIQQEKFKPIVFVQSNSKGLFQ